MRRVAWVLAAATVTIVAMLWIQPNVPSAQAASGTGDAHVLGLTWHIGGVSGYDDVTGVDGGVIGSSLLMVKHPRPLTGAPYTEWILLHGKTMWLSRPGGRPVPVAFTPGHYVISRSPHLFERFATPADKRMLTGKLVQFRRRFSETSTWHFPFLVGKGWNELSDSSGATRQEALAVLAKMGLMVDTKGETENKRVLTQTPDAGGNFAGSPTVELTFDTGAPLPLIVPEGDTQATAIPITCGLSVPVLRTVEMTFMHNDDPTPDLDGPDPDDTPEPLPGDADDVFFRIDAAAAGKLMRVSLPNGPRAGDDPIMLSAWNASGSSLTPIQLIDPYSGQPLGTANDNWVMGVDADMAFRVPASGDVFVVLDAAEYQVGPITLRFQCRSDVSQFAGEQSD